VVLVKLGGGCYKTVKKLRGPDGFLKNTAGPHAILKAIVKFLFTAKTPRKAFILRKSTGPLLSIFFWNVGMAVK
jgi:hypothetical protein